MKVSLRLFAVIALTVGATSLASANSFTIGVSPTQTFGTPGNPTTPTGVTTPNVISLGTLGTDLGLSVTPGTTIDFNAVGEACYNPNSQGCNGSSATNERSVSAITLYPPIEGLFICGGGNCAIPSGATASDLSAGGLGQWTGNVSGMFDITATGTGNIVVPVGATGVEFSFVDSYYADNSDFSGTLGVQASVASPAPEPATYGMMIAGLGALLAFKRVRRS